MLVKVKIISNPFRVFQIFKNVGSTMSVDEKQADILVQAGVAEIIEKPESITKVYKGKR